MIKLGLKLSKYRISSPVPKLPQIAANLRKKSWMSSNNRTVSASSYTGWPSSAGLLFQLQLLLAGQGELSEVSAEERPYAGGDRLTAVTKSQPLFAK